MFDRLIVGAVVIVVTWLAFRLWDYIDQADEPAEEEKT